MTIGILDGEFFIYKTLQQPIINDNIFCLIKELDGFSVIAFANSDKHFPIFKAFYLDELNDFSESEILYQALKPLSKHNISVLVIPAFNRDYIFVDKKHFDKTIKLMLAG